MPTPTDLSSQFFPQDPELQTLIQIAFDLFRRPSPSGQEELMRAYVVQALTNAHCKVTIDAMGNVLATRGQPEPEGGYPLLSFHMDTVEGLFQFVAPLSGTGPLTQTSFLEGIRKTVWKKRTFPLQILPPSSLIVEDGRMHTRGRRILGGDDKCGGAIALALATHTTGPLKIIASVQEEWGCLGIQAAAPAFFQDVAYALVLDRRGNQDLVTHIFDEALCQRSFAQAICQAAERCGLRVRPCEGLVSDAIVLSLHVYNVVNLSVGYYEPHSFDEYVCLDDLCTAYRWVREALASLPRSFPSQEVR